MTERTCAIQLESQDMHGLTMFPTQHTPRACRQACTPPDSRESPGHRRMGPLSRARPGLAALALLATMLLSYPARVWAFAPGEKSERAPQADREETRGTEGKGRKADKGTRRGGRKRMTLEDEFLIEGKLEKPSAFYILRRSSLEYDWARLDARFSPLVLESVQDPLF